MISNQLEIGLQRTGNKMKSIYSLECNPTQYTFSIFASWKVPPDQLFSDWIPNVDFILRQTWNKYNSSIGFIVLHFCPIIFSNIIEGRWSRSWYFLSLCCISTEVSQSRRLSMSKSTMWWSTVLTNTYFTQHTHNVLHQIVWDVIIDRILFFFSSPSTGCSERSAMLASSQSLRVNLWWGRSPTCTISDVSHVSRATNSSRRATSSYSRRIASIAKRTTRKSTRLIRKKVRSNFHYNTPPQQLTKRS